MCGYGGGLNPVRLRFESGVGLCPCDCHAPCPVAFRDNRMTVPGRAWRESCTCPGAVAERTRQDQAGVEFPPDFAERRAETRQRYQSRREAFLATRSRAAGKSREEIRDLYIAELRARGQEMPSEEALDASVAALTGNYLPTARIVGRAAVEAGRLSRDAMKLFRAARAR